MALEGLSPTDRTRIRRERERAADDRADLRALLDEAVVCHLGVVDAGGVRVVPTLAAPRWDGPDPYGTLYLHGSVASQALMAAPLDRICATVTLLDGLVLARSGFMHSVNYRSAVVYGVPRVVDDPDEKDLALTLMVDHVVAGRAGHLRAPTRKELAATSVLALSLHEASVKQRNGDPEDEPWDVDPQVWAGVVPLRLRADDVVTAAGVEAHVPEHVNAAVRSRFPPA
ncbi:MAG: pyridoxamine 5'-phosphate oxidase family protein [Nocardioidaceae bacterium]